MRWSKGILVAAMLAIACGKNGGTAENETKVAGYAQPGGAPARASADVAQQGVAAPVAPGAIDGDMPLASAADTASAPEAVQAPGGAAIPNDIASTMIIRTGTATIKVDSLETAVARLRALATSAGGYVGNTSIQTGKDQLRSATVEIKVPSQRWGQLLVGLKPIGTLEAQDESAQDVGEEYVDVAARVTNAQRLEARLIELLATRTGKLSDALTVERELARVREEIERYEGRLRYLKTRSAISTMTVTVHEPFPVLGSKPGDSPIAQAFRDAWRSFVGLVAGVIASLGVVVPLAVIGWIAWLVWRRRTAHSKL